MSDTADAAAAKRAKRAAYMRDYYAANRERIRARCREARLRNPEAARAKDREYLRRYRAGSGAFKRRHRAETLRRRYGMTVEDYEAMNAAQAGACAACGKVPSRRLVIDHDHSTGAVRALLCTRCNLAIGFIESDLYDRALNYLARYV